MSVLHCIVLYWVSVLYCIELYFELYCTKCLCGVQYNEVTVEDANSPTKCPKTTKLVLEMDPETKEPIIEVHKDLICLLKPHQVQGTAVL